MLAASHFGSSDVALIIVIFGLLVMAAVLALAETGLVRMTRAKAMSLNEEGHRGSQKLLRLVEHPERFLNPVLLLVLICQLVAATLVGVVAEHLVGALGIALATVFEVVIIFVLGEAVPKNWAVQHPDRAGLFAAPLVSAVIRFPPVRLLSAALIGLSNLILPGKGRTSLQVTESELLAMTDVAVEEDVLETEEGTLIRSIIEFGDTVAREVMVPRPDMVVAHYEDSVSEVLELSIDRGHNRIPVYRQNIDDIVGLVFGKDLTRVSLNGQRHVPVGSIVREAHFVPETKRVAELLREMQGQKFHMAVVVDEYGGTAGLVTLEDLVEELVGEIVDEDDQDEPLVESLPTGEIVVSAKMPTDELGETLHAELPEGDWDTVGGLVLGLLGHVPDEGESADIDGHRLIAEGVEGRRIGRVRVETLASEGDAGEAQPDEAESRSDAREGRELERPDRRDQLRPTGSGDQVGDDGRAGQGDADSQPSADARTAGSRDAR